MSKFLFGLVLGIALLLAAEYSVPVAETAAFYFLISVGHLFWGPINPGVHEDTRETAAGPSRLIRGTDR